MLNKKENNKLYNKITFDIKITLLKNEKIFGPGIEKLLELIEENGSLQTACIKMKISYNKAWNIIKRCEKILNVKILQTKIGGVNGGSSILTEEGKDLCNRYKMLCKEIEDYSKKIFNKYFGV